MKIHGASAVVTGGANGIGREITIALLEHGAKVSCSNKRLSFLRLTGYVDWEIMSLNSQVMFN